MGLLTKAGSAGRYRRRMAPGNPRRKPRKAGLALLLSGLLLAFTAGSADASVAVDKTVATHQTKAASTIASPAFSTSAPGELLLAFIGSDGPSAGGSQTVSKVSGGGLTWRLRRRANAQAGTAEIWAANAPAVLT